MKYTAFILLCLFTLFGSSCSKDECEPKTATCEEVAPKDEACLAYYERWFFNSKHNRCEKVGYSGCSAKGFATETECNACKCN